MTVSHSPYRLSVVVAFFILAAFAPLTAYAISLSLFGLPHVIYELQYIDSRFSRRFSPTAWLAVICPVILLTVARASKVFWTAPPQWFEPAVTSISLLSPLILLSASRHKLRLAWLCVASSALFASLNWAHPALLALILSFAHNFTPFGFLLERAQNQERTMTARIGLAIFVGLPLILASGFVTQLLPWSHDLELRIYGDLTASFMKHYLPVARTSPSASETGFFSAAVFLQLIHYDSVIRVLPSAIGERRSVLPWPRRRILTVAVASTSILVALFYIVSFETARSQYGVLATFHAALEWPLLILIACGVGTADEIPNRIPPGLSVNTSNIQAEPG